MANPFTDEQMTALGGLISHAIADAVAKAEPEEPTEVHLPERMREALGDYEDKKHEVIFNDAKLGTELALIHQDAYLRSKKKHLALLEFNAALGNSYAMGELERGMGLTRRDIRFKIRDATRS